MYSLASYVLRYMIYIFIPYFCRFRQKTAVSILYSSSLLYFDWPRVSSGSDGLFISFVQHVTRSDFLGPFFPPFISLRFFIICTLFRVSWTSTDVRRYWAENRTFFNVKKTKYIHTYTYIHILHTYIHTYIHTYPFSRQLDQYGC